MLSAHSMAHARPWQFQDGRQTECQQPASNNPYLIWVLSGKEKKIGLKSRVWNANSSWKFGRWQKRSNCLIWINGDNFKWQKRHLKCSLLCRSPVQLWKSFWKTSEFKSRIRFKYLLLTVCRGSASLKSTLQLGGMGKVIFLKCENQIKLRNDNN